MLGATFDVTAQIGEMNKRIDNLVQAVNALPQVMRGHPARALEAITPVTTFSNPSQITQVGGPPPGTMTWEVRRISFGLNPGGTITTPGTMIVFLGTVEVARTVTLPNFMTFGESELLVTPQDSIGVVWAGGVLAAGSAMLVDLQAVEYPVLGDVTVIA